MLSSVLISSIFQGVERVRQGGGVMSLLTLRGNSAAANAAATAVKPKSELRPNPDFAETEADDLADILHKFIRVAGQVRDGHFNAFFASFASQICIAFQCEYSCETCANPGTMQT
jgi:hypothetical protein